MLKFSSSKGDVAVQCTPNLLPCRVHHDGPVEATSRYWAPESGPGQRSRLLDFAKENSWEIDGKPEAYFRGRKLTGKEIEVPKGYEGVVVKDAGQEAIVWKDVRETDAREEEDGDEEEDEEIGVLQEIGSFDKVVLWGHESIIENEDAFVKGMGEWINFAEAVRVQSRRLGRCYTLGATADRVSSRCISRGKFDGDDFVLGTIDDGLSFWGRQGMSERPIASSNGNHENAGPFCEKMARRYLEGSTSIQSLSRKLDINLISGHVGTLPAKDSL